MQRLVVLGCMLFVVAGCGGGGNSNVQEMTQTGPQGGETNPAEPAASPTLSVLGAYTSGPVDDVGNDVTAVFQRWGVWGGIPRDDAVTCTAIGCPPAGDTIFLAYIDHETDGTVSRITQGVRSGTSPLTGSAIWTGDVAAYETEEITTSVGTSVTAYTPVEGDARLEVDFSSTTVDVDFTNLDNSGVDMSWDGLVMQNGEFRSETADIEGAFYGADHEGVAGTFSRDGLAGVFGALRASE